MVCIVEFEIIQSDVVVSGVPEIIFFIALSLSLSLSLSLLLTECFRCCSGFFKIKIMCSFEDERDT